MVHTAGALRWMQLLGKDVPRKKTLKMLFFSQSLRLSGVCWGLMDSRGVLSIRVLAFISFRTTLSVVPCLHLVVLFSLCVLFFATISYLLAHFFLRLGFSGHVFRKTRSVGIIYKQLHLKTTGDALKVDTWMK